MFLIRRFFAVCLVASSLSAADKAPATPLSAKESAAIKSAAAAGIRPTLEAGGGIAYDEATHEMVAKPSAKFGYPGVELEADEIRYNTEQNVARALGHVTLSMTNRNIRLVADAVVYQITSGQVTLTNVRLGDYPFYVSGTTVVSDHNNFVFTDATVTLKEPNTASPTLRCDVLTYIPGDKVIGRAAHFQIGSHQVFYWPQLTQSVAAPFLYDLLLDAGNSNNLGPWLDIGLRLPVGHGLKVGAEFGAYIKRGLMIGPSAVYNYKEGDTEASGYLRSGFIHDHANRGLDVLGRPVAANRGYLDFTNEAQLTPDITLNAEVNYWKDSEILRDFRYKDFFNVQQPDTFLDSVYTGQNYFVSFFSRFQPNTWEPIQQRLPEIRFDLLPVPVGNGFYQRFNASAAVLREDALTTGPTLHTDRLDAFYEINRPFRPQQWLTMTPVAGARATYYDHASGGQKTYTRGLGEFGGDAALRANGTFDYKNRFWKIDGIRHLVEPKLSYRYIPQAEQGQRYIPQIDRDVFSTNLEPISLGDMRNIDQLHKTNTLRLAVDNTFQTRDPIYGSRDLLTINFADDLRFQRQQNQKSFSEFYTEMSFTPVQWLRLDVFDRMSPQTLAQHELNTGLLINDSTWWSVRISTHYLQHENNGTVVSGTGPKVQEYFVDLTGRFNEVWEGIARYRYDALAHRFTEQSYGVRQNLNNTWRLLYEVAFYRGARREGSFTLNMAIELLHY